MKWEICFSKSPSLPAKSIEALDFEEKCREAFIASRSRGEPRTDTYNYITGKYFRENVFEKQVDLALFVQLSFPASVYNRLFKNYEYSVALGYGP
jgi:hypothetical protein